MYKPTLFLAAGLLALVALLHGAQAQNDVLTCNGNIISPNVWKIDEDSTDHRTTVDTSGNEATISKTQSGRHRAYDTKAQTPVAVTKVTATGEGTNHVRIALTYDAHDNSVLISSPFQFGIFYTRKVVLLDTGAYQDISYDGSDNTVSLEVRGTEVHAVYGGESKYVFPDAVVGPLYARIYFYEEGASVSGVVVENTKCDSAIAKYKKTTTTATTTTTNTVFQALHGRVDEVKELANSANEEIKTLAETVTLQEEELEAQSGAIKDLETELAATKTSLATAVRQIAEATTARENLEVDIAGLKKMIEDMQSSMKKAANMLPTDPLKASGTTCETSSCDTSIDGSEDGNLLVQAKANVVIDSACGKIDTCDLFEMVQKTKDALSSLAADDSGI